MEDKGRLYGKYHTDHKKPFNYEYIFSEILMYPVIIGSFILVIPPIFNALPFGWLLSLGIAFAGSCVVALIVMKILIPIGEKLQEEEDARVAKINEEIDKENQELWDHLK